MSTYKREFIELQEDVQGYSASNKTISGHCKYELRKDKFKISLFVSNLKALSEGSTYQAYVITNDGEECKKYNIGRVKIDNSGHGQLKYQEQITNMQDRLSIHNMDVIAIMVNENKRSMSDTLSPVVGIRGCFKNWKQNLRKLVKTELDMTRKNIEVERDITKDQVEREEDKQEKDIKVKRFNVKNHDMREEDLIIEEVVEENITDEADDIVDEDIKNDTDDGVKIEVQDDSKETETIDDDKMLNDVNDIIEDDLIELLDEFIEKSNDGMHIEVIDGLELTQSLRKKRNKMVIEDVSTEKSRKAPGKMIVEEIQNQNVRKSSEKNKMIIEDIEEKQSMRQPNKMVIEETESRKEPVKDSPVEETKQEMESGNSKKRTNEILKYMFDTYPRMAPFQHINGNEVWIKIEPQDIKVLPFTTFRVDENQFLQKGYSKFKHLVLGMRYTNQQAYLIGVPAEFHPSQVNVAKENGFYMFQNTRNNKPNIGDFGYWMLEVKI